ncbi:MAG: hydantoinase B/oxoprolinase family protein [Actinobacteria bacterium]|nr:hydantoinase B/oxoprolinase family protein [Actinomycetota bacterium]
MTAIDPTTLAVVRGYLDEVVDEMDVVQVKAAFSPIVSEMKDRANGLFRADTGETIAQGNEGSPIFVTTMQHAVQATLDWLGTIGRRWEPGDAYLLNDPYLAGTHLQDAKLVAPFFWDGEPRMLLANTGHWMDVGAAQAGAFGPTCREIYEEGVRLPVMRFVRDGELDPEILALIRANNRLPDLQEGDLRSQYNALLVGQRRLERLFDRYGPDVVMACVHELDERSEQQMRSRIADIPDGRYHAEDALDNDGITDEELELRLEITVDGEHMTVDFTGTTGACEGPMNLTRSTTVTACYTGLKHLFPDIPINGGCFRPVDVTVPQGSLLDAPPPHAVGGYPDTSARIVGMVAQALVEAVPDIAPATSFETGGVAVVSGARNGDEVFVAVFPYGGGYGGCRGGDGLVNGTSVVGMASFPSIEASEHDYPILWHRFGIREGSGGAGQWMGGCGNEYEFEVEVPARLSILGEQAKHPPPGALGGLPGAPNVVAYTLNGEWQGPDLGAKVRPVAITAGDRIRMRSPGGGGYGDPADRDPAAIERDIANGYLTPEQAREWFGGSDG